jgi:mono/diheme cytochrome c family protein
MFMRSVTRWSLGVLATFVMASSLAADPTETVATATPGGDLPVVSPVVNGRKTYQRFCSVCHGTRGEGGLGPVLQGVFVGKGKDAVVAQITQPKGAMPQMYPTPIDDKALADLLIFLEKLN